MKSEQTSNIKLRHLKITSLVTGLLVLVLGGLFFHISGYENAILICFISIILGIITIRTAWLSNFFIGIMLGQIEVVFFSLMLISSFFFGAQALAEKKMCHDQMQRLGSVFQKYCEQNDGTLPVADTWCDQLLEFVEDAEHDDIMFDLTMDKHRGHGEEDLARRRYNRYGNEKMSPYAFNQKLDGYRLTDIDRQTVLLFKSELGWNQNGTSEILSPYGHSVSSSGGGYNFVVVGPGSIFTVEFVKYSEIDSLNWEPAE